MKNRKIQFDDSVWFNNPEFIETLNKKIDDICTKIGFDDSNIMWIIYTPKTYTPLIDLICDYRESSYGYCCPSEKKIFISTEPIQDAIQKKLLFKCIPSSSYRKENDLLANVILDEITHIQTGCDHGNANYNKRHQKNRNLYYNDGITGFLLSNKSNSFPHTIF